MQGSSFTPEAWRRTVPLAESYVWSLAGAHRELPTAADALERAEV
ncbi:hypothetical protein AB4Z54_00920 [Streptomyces sp. MCAF7]